MDSDKLERAAKCFAIGATVGCAAGILITLRTENRRGPEESATSTPIAGEDNHLPTQPIPQELVLSADKSGVCFGLDPKNPDIIIGKPAANDGHVLVVGGSGSGKTTSIVFPSLRRWKGSTITAFIKGDPDKFAEQRRKEGRLVYAFKPAQGRSNLVRYDVFAAISPDGNNLIDEAILIADTLLPLLPESHDPIWREAARAYLVGALIYLYRVGLSFVEAIRTITEVSVRQAVMLILESECKEALPFISKLKDVGNRVSGGVGFELLSLTKYLSPDILTAFTLDEGCELLDWEILNTSQEPVDVILWVPESKLTQLAPMLSIMISQLIRTLESRQERTYGDTELPPLLVSLDEFARLGRIPPLLDGLNTLRSRGVTFLLSVQSLANIGTVYGEAARKVIMANCPYKAVLSLDEPEEQRYFSDLIGTTETLEQSGSSGQSVGIGVLPPSLSVGSTGGVHVSRGKRPIISPHAFGALDGVACITPHGPFQTNKYSLFDYKEDAHHER